MDICNIHYSRHNTSQCYRMDTCSVSQLADSYTMISNCFFLIQFTVTKISPLHSNAEVQSLTWFWRQSWGYLVHVSEGTVWFSTFCIIFTIWMNKQTLLSKFTIGKGSIKQNKTYYSHLISQTHGFCRDGPLYSYFHHYLF